jgi:hypothetical protein
MADTHNRGTPRTPVERPAVATEPLGPMEADVVQRTDRVRWGPILAGLLTTITTLVVLTVLGLAIGLSAFEPGETAGDTIGRAAAFWGALSALIAFLLGGWVAARTSSVGDAMSGAMNGALVGAAAIALVIWMIGAGLGNLLGVVGTNMAEIIAIGQEATVSPEDALATAEAGYGAARDSAWGTFLGLILALGAATLGGYLGRSYGHGAEMTRGRVTMPTRGPRSRA